VLNLAARQHPTVDPGFEIGGGAQRCVLFAGEGRQHLAEDPEAYAFAGLVPHHGFLGGGHGNVAPDFW
jgi:hypothetical protein